MGKSPFFMGKSPLFMGKYQISSILYHFFQFFSQRPAVSPGHGGLSPGLGMSRGDVEGEDFQRPGKMAFSQ